jgi:glycosyltransferase involved in cell wall biosynthesis
MLQEDRGANPRRALEQGLDQFDPSVRLDAGDPPTGEKPLLSVIVPVHDEADGIVACDDRLHAVLCAMPVRFEIIYVNDGSRDHSLLRLHELRARSPHVAVLDLSRNFGKEIALSAGLDHAAGDAVVLIDADLQDPPELIPELYAKWREGFDNVFAQRISRAGESWFKRASAHAFYRVLNRISDQPVPVDTGDFRLLSRRCVDALKQIREQHRFMKGLYAWVGFRQVRVPYHRAARHAGISKWNYWKLWNLSLEGITSFTTVPLRLTSYAGLGSALLAVLYGVFMLFKTLIFGNPVAGYPSLIVIVLFIGGIQLLSIGVMGEYLGRLFNEAKGRPLYLVGSFEPAAETTVKRSETAS